MVKVSKNGGEVLIRDFLVNLYLRNGYEIVPEEVKKEPVADEPKEVKQTRKPRKAKK